MHFFVADFALGLFLLPLLFVAALPFGKSCFVLGALFFRHLCKLFGLFVGCNLCLFLSLDCGEPLFFCLFFFLYAHGPDVLFKLCIVVQPLLFAPLFEFLAVDFLRLDIELFLLFGGADFGFYPDFAARLTLCLLTGTDDDEFFADSLFDGYGNEHKRIYKTCDCFKPYEEQGKHRAYSLRLVEYYRECAVCIC